ncbi:MAG: hypothetical protein KKD44_08060 [Proteobacteria bacterium]|nr:hypothetical protein [Pseudomonadota bacterium]
MIKNLILILVIYLVYRTVKNWMIEQQARQNPDNPLAKGRDDKSDVMIKDPQCGVYFPQREGLALNVKGETLHFCSEKCRDDYKNKM